MNHSSWHPKKNKFFYVIDCFDNRWSTILQEKCNALVCFQDYWLTPKTNTGIFNVFYPHLHASRETSPNITHPNTTPIKTSTTMEFLFVRLLKRRWILLVYVVPFNSYKPFFKHAVSYLHRLSSSHSNVNSDDHSMHSSVSGMTTTPWPLRPWVLHSHQLQLGSSSNHIILGEVCSDTICNTPDSF